MASIFDLVLANRPKKSVFDLSHERKMSGNMGYLYPIMVQEVIPGDKFRVNTEILLRMSPLVAPMMHRCNVYTHYFFVPNRLVWKDWEEFITGGKDGKQEPVPPTIRVNLGDQDLPCKTGKLPDYMGIPTFDTQINDPIDNSIEFGAMPFRAYQKIYNEYYRDQNLINEVDVPLSGGPLDYDSDAGAYEMMVLRKRAWERDYFTSALPFTQKGDPVTIPLGSTNVVLDRNAGKSGLIKMADFGDGIPASNTAYVGGQTIGDGRELTGTVDTSSKPYVYDPNGTLKTSGGAAATINDLRAAFQLQKFQERNARAGSRYTEVIRAHFGVKSSDARLQRPEYLGGGKSPITISEVLQTSETASSPQGNMAGHGLSVGNTHSFSKYFEEHGYIIGIMSVIPRTAYQQGLPRMYTRNDKTDFFWPEFQNLGEQAVLNRELYLKPYALNNSQSQTASDNIGTFGYQSRYAEYRYNQSTVHGDFKNSLNFWHLGRIFSNLPQLNQSFIESDPSQRIFAIDDSEVHHLWIQMYHNVQAIRPIPKVATPGFIDH